MRSLSEQRGAGEGREQGWAKAGRRLNTGRWRRAEARGRSLQPRSPAPLLRESFFSPQAPHSGPRLGSVGASHCRGRLCLPGSGSLPQPPQDSS